MASISRLGRQKLFAAISAGFNELVIEHHVCDVRDHVKVKYSIL